MIHSRGLARTFHGKRRDSAAVHAVNGVDIDVDAGEIVGFLGPNGAGKTTTVRMLTTLLRPTDGTATVAGRDLIKDPAGVRARVGYVAQSGGTSPENTIVEELVLQGRLYGLRKGKAVIRAGELLEMLELDGLGGRLTKTLSGGQRRRLDVALGLIHAPALVFLDEPTAGLDPQSRANLWAHLRAIRAEQGMTVLLTTHYLDEADALADRIIVIDNGSIVAEGTPDALKARVSGDGVTVGVHPAQVAETAELVTNLPGVRDITISPEDVRFRVPRGDLALPVLVRILDDAGISATSMQVLRPTLDDVFFSLTGRSLREQGNPMASAVREEGTHVA